MPFDIENQIKNVKVVLRDVADLVPYALNSRTHSPQQVSMIAASIKEFGFTNPVLTDGANGIVAGHGRVLAAQKLKLKRVPAIDLAHLSDTQRRAYVIADNQLALKAGWDEDILASELGILSEDGFDLATLGFEDADIKKLLGEMDAPEEPAEAEDEAKNILVIEFQTEAELATAFEEAKTRGWQCKIMS